MYSVLFSYYNHVYNKDDNKSRCICMKFLKLHYFMVVIPIGCSIQIRKEHVFVKKEHIGKNYLVFKNWSLVFWLRVQKFRDITRLHIRGVFGFFYRCVILNSAGYIRLFLCLLWFSGFLFVLSTFQVYNRWQIIK